MENKEKNPEEKQADMIYLFLVFVAFIVSVMVLVSVYSDKSINIYVVSNPPAPENLSAMSSEAGLALAEEAPTVGKAEEIEETAFETGAQEVLMEKSIDINRADKDELDKLPGIGPALAERIIEYRIDYGDFSDIEEIMDVSGIGEKTFAKIRDFIYVS